MARYGLGRYHSGMDQDRLSRQMAMRLRADRAMDAALAAADVCPPSLAVFIRDAMSSIDLVRLDSTLAPRDRRILLDEMVLLIGSLKKLVRADLAARPELIMEVGRRTNGMLRRYTRFVRA